MAETHYPFEASLLESVGNMADGPSNSSGDNSSLISIMKGVMVQNQTIISNQATIIAKLNAGIQVQVVTSL